MTTAQAQAAAAAELPFDYKAEVDRMLLFCSVVADIPAAQILETIHRTHSVGAILDPTAYRDRLFDGSLDAVAAIARAVLELQKAHAIAKAAVAGRAR